MNRQVGKLPKEGCIMEKRNFLYLIIYAMLIANHSFLWAAWEIRKIDDVESPGGGISLALDSNDYPHISYNCYSLAARRDVLKYAKWTGSGWSIETVDSAGAIRYTSIALDTNNYPHISYHDSTSHELKYAKWNGSSWNISIVGSVGDWGGENSIALDINNYPNIAYLYQEQYDIAANLKYAKWTGSSWNIQTVDSIGDLLGSDISIALDTNNHPHILYDGGEKRGVKYAKWTGSSWSIQKVDNSADASYDTSLALDLNNCPHICYYDHIGAMFGDKGNLMYAKRTGSFWKILTIDSTGDTGKEISLKIDSNNRPHIAYGDSKNYQLKYATWTGPTIKEDQVKLYIEKLEEEFVNPSRDCEQIIDSLGESQAKLSIPILKKYLRHKDGTLRNLAKEALRKIDGATLTAELRKIDEEKHTRQAQKREKAITKSEPKKEPKIITTIDVSKANVRSGPGINYDTVTQIYKEQELGVFERKGKWLLIGHGKEWLESGWIHMKLFSPITLSKLLKQEGFLPPLGCTEKEVLSKYGSPADVANFKGEKVYGYGRLYGSGTRTYGGKTIHFEYGVCIAYKRIFSGDWNKSDSYSFLADVVPAELFGKKYKYSEKNLGDLQYQKAIRFSSHSDIWIITAFAWPIREYDPQKGYYRRNPSLKEYKVLAVTQGVSGFFKK